MGRKLSLRWLDRQLEAQMLFVYCKMLLSAHICSCLCSNISPSALIALEILQIFWHKWSERLLSQLPLIWLYSILSGVRFMLLMFWDVNSVLQNHLHTLRRGVEAIRLVCGLWLLTTDLALLTKRCCYKRDHHCSLPPSFLPAPLLLSYTYQLLRLVLILSLSCLYLAVHTKPKPACPHSINGISQLLHLLFYRSVSRFLVLCLKPGGIHFHKSWFGFLRK